jgi:hypothetical protein
MIAPQPGCLPGPPSATIGPMTVLEHHREIGRMRLVFERNVVRYDRAIECKDAEERADALVFLWKAQRRAERLGAYDLAKLISEWLEAY